MKQILKALFIFDVLLPLTALIALTVSWLLSWHAYSELQANELKADQVAIGCKYANILYVYIALYDISVRSHPGAPLPLKDLIDDDPRLYEGIKDWSGAGRFYFLNRVPPFAEPYAVYEIDGDYIPDVREHPDWQISKLVLSHRLPVPQTVLK